jgi:hypothetical protein
MLNQLGLEGGEAPIPGTYAVVSAP